MIPPRVLLVDPAHRVPFYDRSLAAALARAGADVTLAVSPLPYYDLPPSPPGVRIDHRFGRALSWLDSAGLDPAEHAALRRAARATMYGPELAALWTYAARATSIVHSQWSLTPRLDAAAWRVLRRRGIPVIHTAHNVLPHEAGHARSADGASHEARHERSADPATRARWRRLYTSVDRVIVHSEATKTRLLALGGVPESAVRVVPMPAETWPIGGANRSVAVPEPPTGVRVDAAAGRGAGAHHRAAVQSRSDDHRPGDTGREPRTRTDARSRADVHTRADARTRLDLPSDHTGGPPLALFFGQIRPYKGLDILLDAWPTVLASVPDARLLIAGPAGRDETRRLEREVAERAFGDRVILRTGYVPTDRVSDHFMASDVVVLPYLDTDDSAVLATALGHGRATVVSAVGGLPEALCRGGGLFVSPGDPIPLAEALIEVLGGVPGDAAVRDRMEAEARASAAVGNWDAAASATLDVYAEVLDEGARADRRAPKSGSAGLPTDHPLPATPLVSVLMPARNAADHIAASIEAVLAGDWPVDCLELIVAEGRSNDGTRDVVEGLAAADGRVRIVDNPAGTTAAGLNVALRAGSGDVIVRLDAHALPAPDYIPAAVAALRRTGAWAVGGPMVGRGETAFGRAVALAQATRLGSGGAAYRHGRAGAADTVYLGAWPRPVLDALGGWDEALTRNQDAELCLRIAEAGGSIVLDPAIRTVTITRATPPALARQYFGYGAGRAATLARHPHSLALRQAIPAAFVAALALGIAAAPFARLARLALGFVAFGYLATICVAGFAAARSSRAAAEDGMPAHAPDRPLATAGRIALAFSIMHIGWGLGFWRGVAGVIIGRLR